MRAHACMRACLLGSAPARISTTPSINPFLYSPLLYCSFLSHTTRVCWVAAPQTRPTVANPLYCSSFVHDVIFMAIVSVSQVETPCVLEHVYAKTTAFRRIEAGIFTRFLTRMECTRGLPKGSKRNCLAVFLRRCESQGRLVNRLRQIVEYDVRFSPSLANLTLRLRDFEGVIQKTDVSRNRQAMNHAVAEIQDAVFNVLYLI